MSFDDLKKAVQLYRIPESYVSIEHEYTLHSDNTPQEHFSVYLLNRSIYIDVSIKALSVDEAITELKDTYERYIRSIARGGPYEHK